MAYQQLAVFGADQLKKQQEALAGAKKLQEMGMPGFEAGGYMQKKVRGQQAEIGQALDVQKETAKTTKIPEKQRYQEEWAKRRQEILAQQAPQIGYEASPFRAQQQQLLQQLQARAEGTAGPSLAELQLQRGLEAGQRAAASQAASARGVSPAAAARMAMQGQEALAGQAAQQAAMIRAQEQMQAQQALGQQLAGVRGQDLAAQQANIQAELAQRGQALGQERFLYGMEWRPEEIEAQMGYGARQADLNRAAQIQLAMMQAEKQKQLQEQQFLQGLAQAGIGGAFSLAGGALGGLLS